MLLRLRVAVGRHRDVRPTSHLQGTFRAHVEGGSGRSEASPTTILQDTHSVEGVFSEVEGAEWSARTRTSESCVSSHPLSRPAAGSSRRQGCRRRGLPTVGR